MTKLSILRGPEWILPEAVLPSRLAGLALSGNTSQFTLRSPQQDFLVYHPFTQGGGPLVFPTLVFPIDARGNPGLGFTIDADGLQGISGQQLVRSGPNSTRVWLADSGKEWNPAFTGVYRGLGFDEVGEPPQNYARWPLGKIFNAEIDPATGLPKIVSLTPMRAFNHSIAQGDFNGDGRTDLLVSGFTSADVDPRFWDKVGYVALARSDGTYAIHWVTSPNLTDVGTSALGMSNVSATDLDGDGRDEIIFSGGSDTASPKDRVVAVFAMSDEGSFELLDSVQGYGKWLQHPAYNSALIDFDRDGYQDLLAYFGVAQVGFEVLHQEAGGRYVPAGSLGLEAIEPWRFQFFQVLDFDRDGHQDLVLDNLTQQWPLRSTPQELAKALVRWVPESGGGFFKPLSGSTITQISGDASTFNGTLSYLGPSVSPSGHLAHRFAGLSHESAPGGTAVSPWVFELQLDQKFLPITVRVAGLREDYSLSRGMTGEIRLLKPASAGQAAQILTELDRLVFSDQGLAFDLAGNAGHVARTLGAVFGSDAVSNLEYAGIGLSLLDGGMSPDDLMQLALRVRLGENPTHTELITLLHTNVVGSSPDAVATQYFLGLLESGAVDSGGLARLAAQTPLNELKVDLVGLGETGLAYLPMG